MIRTVIRQAISNGTVVAFAEGDAGTSTWTPSLTLEIVSGGESSFLIMPLENITVKTVSGFTVASLLSGTFYCFGTVSDSSTVEDDPDLADNAIISLANVKAYIKRPGGNTEDDAFLRFWINTISGVIEEYVGGKVVLQNITGMILDGTDDYEITVPFGPIAQIGTGGSPAEADIQYRTDPTASWTNLLDNISYAMISPVLPNYYNRNWIKLFSRIFPYGVQNIKINYKAGYSTVPSVFTKVMIESVVMVWTESRRGDGRLGKSSVNTSIESTSGNISFSDLSVRHQAMLRPYIVKPLSRSIALYR